MVERVSLVVCSQKLAEASLEVGSVYSISSCPSPGTSVVHAKGTRVEDCSFVKTRHSSNKNLKTQI